ncbi:uncharacterized protein FSUBG_7941 [Fusarium subglutinans]|uniref:Uncharacterized protein n=1 Tax=Gibberella subglutinans TaxID=42677 RepID=A0A8H5PSA9_GIBSU|nr:uncharacterized protein FSUBG_7941 [Fusarium subglutinans]KAF5601959.1 hypothetical protein FSUBG_7941 [Fusarium subglutinans]
MSHLEVLDLIILILEGLLCIASICESGYKIYKVYKSYIEDRKKRMRNKMMRDWDGPDDKDKDMEMGWGANSWRTSPPYYRHGLGDYTREPRLTKEVKDASMWKGFERSSDDQQAMLDEEQLDSLDHEIIRQLELAEMEREARRILPTYG